MPPWEELLRLAAVVLACVLAGGHAALAQTLTASTSDAAPPPELAPAVKAAIAPASTRVQSGSATLEFWWVKSLDASGSGEGWARTPEGSLVGVVRLSEPYPDIRGRRIKPGVYTLRFGMQPMNGDHLGVSPFREFLLVSPAAADTTPAATGHDGTIGLSKQTTGASHPAVWSLDPPAGAAGEPSSTYRNDAGHQGVIFDIQTSAGALKFGLILIGKIEA